MATNFVFKEAEALTAPVPTGTKAGKALRIGALNVVTVTAEGSVTETITLGAGTQIIQPSGSLSGNLPGYASVALKGAANLPVTGVTAWGTPVYIKVSDNTLQVTGGVGTKNFGVALAAKTAPLAGVLVKIINGGVVADAA